MDLKWNMIIKIINEESIGNPLINIKNNKIIGIQKTLGVGTILLNPIKEFIEKCMKQELEAKNIYQSIKSLKSLKSTRRLDEGEFNKEICMTYLVPNINDIPILKIFGTEFVEKNKDKCKLILYDEERDHESEIELCSFLELYLLDNVIHGKKFFKLYLVQTDYFIDLSKMFYQCATLLAVEGLNELNTEKVTSMSAMFDFCLLLQELDISGLNTSQVTDVSFMFHKCQSLRSVDFSGWNTSKLEKTNAMFEFCESLEEITGLSNWDVSNLKDASFMFNYCKNLMQISELSNWNTINLKNMTNMFKGLESMVTFPDISKWNTGKVTDMSLLFAFCSRVTSFPDLSNWDTKNVEAIPLIFHKCASLKTLPDISKWNTSKIKDFSHI